MSDLEERWKHEDEIQSYRMALAERGRTIRALREERSALEARLAEREAEIHVLRARLWRLLVDRPEAADAEARDAGEVAP